MVSLLDWMAFQKLSRLKIATADSSVRPPTLAIYIRLLVDLPEKKHYKIARQQK
jgi:hypothetical protein